MTWSTVWPTRTRSPSASVRRESIRSSFTKVPLADPRSSIVEQAVGRSRDLRVLAGEHRIVSEPALRLGGGTADVELALDLHGLAPFLAFGHAQLFAGHRSQP